MQQTLISWLSVPPRTLIVGNGTRPEHVEDSLPAAGRMDDSMLQSFPPSEWKTYGGCLLPLRHVRSVVVIKESGDEPALLPWRHARVWDWLRFFGKAERQRVRWVIQCSVTDMEEVRETPLAGSGNGAATFGRFAGYVVLSSREGIDEIRAALSSGERADLVTWEALQRADEARNALVSLRDALQNERLDPHAVTAAVRLVNNIFDERPYGIDRFCSPNCHEHGGRWRKWLKSAIGPYVTESVTQLVVSGRALLPLLHL